MQGSELKAGARTIMRENAPKIFIIALIFIVVITVMSELQFRLTGYADAYGKIVARLGAGERPGPELFFGDFRPVGVALALILSMMGSVVNMGFMSYCLNTTRGNPGDYKDLLDGFLFFGKTMLIAILSFIFVFLWSLLLIFPGVIASYRYRQAYYILLDSPDKSALQCIRESKLLMAGNKLDLFLLDLSFIGWHICDFLVSAIIPTPFALPIVSIWIMPYTGLTYAAYYDQLINTLVV